MLLLHGADPDAADDEGASPLLSALIDRHNECALLLLDHGATVAFPVPQPLSGGADDSSETSQILSLLIDVMCNQRFARSGHARDARARLFSRLLAAGFPTESRDSDGDTPLLSAAAYGDIMTVRLLCARGASVEQAVRLNTLDQPAASEEDGTYTALYSATLSGEFPGSAQLEKGYVAAIDELIERGAADAAGRERGGLWPPFEGGLGQVARLRGDTVAGRGGHHRATQLRNAVRRVSMLLARWPPDAPLPDCEGEGALLLPAALEHAQSRLEVLRGGSGDGGQQREQQELAAAFLRHVRDACGGAVAPAYVPFARLRFVAAGGLERASAWEREVHRFPLERVALCRAALQVTTEAEAAAAERSLPLLRDATTHGRAAQKQLYAAVCAAGRWGAIREAVNHAAQGLRSAEAALGAAVIEAEAAVQRLAAAAAAAAAATPLAPAGAAA